MKKSILLIIAVVALCLAPAFSQTTITGGIRIPSVSGQSGKYLSNNGTKYIWSPVAANLSGSLTANYIPYAVSSMSLVNSVIGQENGKIIINNSNPSGSFCLRGTESHTSTANLLYTETGGTPTVANFYVKHNGHAFFGGDIKLSEGLVSDKNITFYSDNYKIGVSGSSFQCASAGGMQLKVNGAALNGEFAKMRILGAVDAEKFVFDTFKNVLSIRGCPTSTTGLVSGDIWSNLGVLNIMP